MATSTWKIVSVDSVSKHMVVQYTIEGDVTSLNIPMVPIGEDKNAWISGYAPIKEYERRSQGHENVSVGEEGEIFGSPSSISEAPQISGNWNEEYLRAMIYQVLEEIRETEV